VDLFSGGAAELVESCAVCGSECPRPAGVQCPVCVQPGSTARCQGPSCRVMVHQLKTLQGGNMPVDAGVFPDGDLVLEHSALAGWRVRVLLAWERERWGPVRWRSHWASCPDAELFRHQRVTQ